MSMVPINRGYRRLFWSAFFLLLLKGNTEEGSFAIWDLIGFCLAISGAGIICGASGSQRLRYARMWGLAGLVLWAAELLVFVGQPFPSGYPWEVRFLFYGAEAVICLQLYMYAVTGGAELLGGREKELFSRRAVIFACLFAISALAGMAGELLGYSFFSIQMKNGYLAPLPLLMILPGGYGMWVLALLRRYYVY